jgi:hypothetical protein
MRLIVPPADPRPDTAEVGPFVTSTCPRLNGSRDCGLRSRTPSTKMSLRALLPRIVRLSPPGTPPSPAVIVRPGTLRRTSVRLVAPCCSMTSFVMTEIVCGMSRSGSVYRGDVTGARSVTSIDSRFSAIRSVAVEPAVISKARPVPASARRSACGAGIEPETPGDARLRIPASGISTFHPETRSNSRRTSSSAPAAIEKRITGRECSFPSLLTGTVGVCARPVPGPVTAHAASVPIATQ